MTRKNIYVYGILYCGILRSLLLFFVLYSIPVFSLAEGLLFLQQGQASRKIPPSSFQVGASTYVFDWNEIHSASFNMVVASLNTYALQVLYQSTYLKLFLLYSLMSAGVNKAHQAKQWLSPTVLPDRMRIYIDDPKLANAVYLKVWKHAGIPVLHIGLLTDSEGIADDASSSLSSEWYNLIRRMQDLPLRQVEIAIVPPDENNRDGTRALSVREVASATTPLTIPLAKSGITFALEDFPRLLGDLNPGEERVYSLLDPKILTRVIEQYSSLHPGFFDNEKKNHWNLNLILPQQQNLLADTLLFWRQVAQMKRLLGKKLSTRVPGRLDAPAVKVVSFLLRENDPPTFEIAEYRESFAA